MKRNYKRDIIKTASLSRLLVILLQYVFNHMIPDHNAGVFLYPKENGTEFSMDKAVNHIFGGFLRWDAHYFMHIAKYGYTYENTVAFFPLFPLLGNLLAKCLFFLEFLSTDSLLLLSFIILNYFVFIYSALMLFNLTNKFFSDEFSYYSVILFCWNPASIFFTAPYTECIFSFLTFKSMLNCILLYEKYHKFRVKIRYIDIFYLFPIALTTLTRSNGLVNVGFFLYVIACIFLKNFLNIKGNFFLSIIKKISLILAFTIITFFGLIFCLFLFDLFQIYCYKLFCQNFSIYLPLEVEMYAKQNSFVLLGTFSKHNQSWCNSKLPLSYSYVQKHYWNVGFLNYYEFKQIPNFLLAAPILTIFIINCKKYMLINCPKNIIQIFNFDIHQPRSNMIFETPQIFVFVLHGLILSIFCIFFIHIQVSTRLLCSASPLLYWFSVHYLMDGEKFCDINNIKRFSVKKKIILLYYFSYYVVGIALFCNFLPWT